MGSCQQSDVIEVNSSKHRNIDDSSEIQENQLIEQQKTEFPDMPEWDGDRYTGIGLKRMKGYKCDLPIDELDKKREQFWDCKNSRGNPNYKMWRVINQACVYDELRANMLLEEYGLTTHEGCINHIIDQDGNHYHIPNYCINDPFFERELKTKKNINEKNIKIKMFEPSALINEEKTVANTMTGKELKELFKKEHNIGDNFNLRLFFGGMEIKDDNFLYQHHLKNGYKIQVMKLPKIEIETKNEKSENKKHKKKSKKKKKKENKESEKEENDTHHDKDKEE